MTIRMPEVDGNFECNAAISNPRSDARIDTTGAFGADTFELDDYVFGALTRRSRSAFCSKGGQTQRADLGDRLVAPA